MKRRVLARLLPFLAPSSLALAWATDARAVDLPVVAGAPVRVDVTETSIVAQHFDAREGEDPKDFGYGDWINRINATLSWKKWTVGLRLDSSLYWRRPADRDIGSLYPNDPPEYLAGDANNVAQDGTSRYRNSIYPAKIWATYQSSSLEATVGDSYVQFGRGLILSMRKIDDLGIDNTLRGAKVAYRADPFAVTLVAGIANPSRVDEATGRALFLPNSLEANPATNRPATSPQPLFGSDRIIGADISAGRGTPVVLSTHVVRLTRCAPYSYDAQGHVDDGTFSDPIGSCNPQDTQIWLSSLPTAVGPVINASEVEMAGQSLEIPSLWGHGQIYLEAATQRRHHDDNPNDPYANGNALYGSFSGSVGPVTNTLEVKSYRNFYPLAGAVNSSRASAFSNIAYSTPPTAELLTQDNEYGFFNACVDGGRLRTDVRLSDGFLVYGQGAYFHSKSEQADGACDEKGNTVTTNKNPDAVHDSVWDGLTGIEWSFDGDRSHVFASTGVRNDHTDDGTPFYRELHGEYTITKHISGPYSVELQGQHRLRYEENANTRQGEGNVDWHEGQNYTALQTPKWVLAQGIEYTTKVGLPTYYFNGSILYRFTEKSNIKILVGQQRGGLKCVSGVCRIFPAFEGARAELTLRF
ncbi:MAG TPA: DUF6029 family protein [Polyangiaceae bacterium]